MTSDAPGRLIWGTGVPGAASGAARTAGWTGRTRPPPGHPGGAASSRPRQHGGGAARTGWPDGVDRPRSPSLGTTSPRHCPTKKAK